MNCTITVYLIPDDEDEGSGEDWNFNISLPDDELYEASRIAAKAAFDALKKAGFKVEGLTH